MTTLRIGIVDSGVNAWHSHVRGAVGGCALEVAPDGRIVEHDDYRDRSGHGTAIAGVIREGLADARLYAVRVFDDALAAYPSVVARGILRAAAEGCDFINLSVAIPPGPGGEALEAACAAAIEAGSVLVACAPPGREGWLPAALPGIHGVIADERLSPGEVREAGLRRFAACGAPRDLDSIPHGANFAGHSFACARALVHLARQRPVR